MDTSLAFASYTALVLLNTVDSVLTRWAIRRGYQEKNPYLKKLIVKFGLDMTLLLKTLIVAVMGAFFLWLFLILLPFALPSVTASLASLDLTVIFSIGSTILFCVVCYDLFQLRKVRH
jgi:maltodextrin utilization protein YvdJ